MIQVISFYIFAAVLLASAAMVIFARNPVHSVLWLIVAFFNAAGLMVLVGAEFIAMLLVIVYVGAVAVLFLFVVMMLDIDFAELRAGFMRNLPLGLLLAIVLVVELILGIGAFRAGAAFLQALEQFRHKIDERGDRLLGWLRERPHTLDQLVARRLLYPVGVELPYVDSAERRSIGLHLVQLQARGAVRAVGGDGYVAA